MKFLFWLSVGTIVYVYAVYPILLALLSAVWRARAVRGSNAFRPHVTLVISAHNEEAVIREKLLNSLALAYPADRLEIMVVSDASSDRTDAIVGEFADRGVKLLRMNERSGKSLGLNHAVREARGEVLVFSDANSMYLPDTITALVRNLADPTVGAVTGEQRYIVEEGEDAAGSEGLYWRYEQQIKVRESRVGSVVGGDGAIYALRKSLFKPLKASDLSDFVTPLQVVFAGHRNVYETGAVAYERGSPSFTKEYRRKVRIVNRAWRALFGMPQVLNPLRTGLFAWQIFSHKLLRWLVPVFMIVALVSNVVLATTGSLYLLLLAGQVLIYTFAALGLLLNGSRGNIWAFRVPYYFCLVNIASLHGIVDVARGQKYTTWSTVRT